ncbi:MAG: hypothetical protein IK134_03470 [Oscillospiraceae bacterium]|nr:hypothetical protein [Oscillospiraceae bacterium]
MDLSKLMGMFGFDAEDAQKLTEDPQLQNMMQNPEMQNAVEQAMQNPAVMDMMQTFDGMFAQGGVMPDDVDSIMDRVKGMEMGEMFSQLGDMFGGMGFDEIDLDEEVEAYEPEAVDAGDRAFVTELKAWLKDALTDLPAADVCMLQIAYHLGYFEDETPCGDLWLSYNTAQTDAENRAKSAERWHFANWTDNYFRSIDDEPLTEWLESQGYDLEEDDEDLTQRIYDLAALAVMELHREKFTEQRFGRKIPFIIEDYEFNQKTAIRAVKANGGKELFDSDFFAECGFEPDDQEA